VFNGPRPTVISVAGWTIVGAAVLVALVLLAVLVFAMNDLVAGRPLAGERLFAAAVGLALALFVARVWHGFRTLPDWRVALEVPLRVKLFAAGGSALAASLAATTLALMMFAVCSKTLFLELTETLWATDIGKGELLLGLTVTAGYFLVLWYVCQAVMELREWARPTLATIFIATILLACAVGGVGAGGTAVAPALAIGLGGLSLLGLVLQLIALGGDASYRHFRAYES